LYTFLKIIFCPYFYDSVFMTQLLDFILHIDKHLFEFVQQYGNFTYAILFLIVFAETGLVVVPFLPGDALLLGAGIVWAQTDHNPLVLFLLLAIAAVLGNTVNYYIGRSFGNAIIKRGIINPKYLEQTHAYFEKYGAFAIIVARFAPFIRTFAPFIAGMSKMSYPRFAAYNLIGAVLWTSIFIFVGYAFGGTQFVKDNFGTIEIVVILVTTIPVLFTIVRGYLNRDK
jgi:membrane-associated protein